MSDRVVERSDWAAFASRLSRQLQGAQAEIEIAALGVGDQIEAEWAPLIGLAYDHKDDIFEVAVEGLDHIIHKPESVALQQDGALVRSVTIGAHDGERHILRFREPLSLPAPQDAPPPSGGAVGQAD